MKVFAACDDCPKIQSLPLLFLRISAPPAVSAVKGFGCGYNGTEKCSCTISHLPERFSQITVCRPSTSTDSPVFFLPDKWKVTVVHATLPRRVALRSPRVVNFAAANEPSTARTPLSYSAHPVYWRGVRS